MIPDNYTAVTCVACGKVDYYTKNLVEPIRDAYYHCGECSAKIRGHPDFVLGSFDFDIFKGE